MYKRSISLQTTGAFVIALAAFGLAGLLVDSTPLLIKPSPDLDWPLALLGVVIGLWAAHRITGLKYVASKKLGRLAFWIMLPVLLSLDLPALGDRVGEAVSFRRSGMKQEATVLIVEKNKRTSRNGRFFYETSLVNPFDAHRITLRIDEATFARVDPMRDCVTLQIERAPNGAVRLLRPLHWKVPCANRAIRVEPH